MEVNFFGLIAVTKKAMDVMREQGGGLIQQVTSIGGQRGVPMFSIYCASKVSPSTHCRYIAREKLGSCRLLDLQDLILTDM